MAWWYLGHLEVRPTRGALFAGRSQSGLLPGTLASVDTPAQLAERVRRPFHPSEEGYVSLGVALWLIKGNAADGGPGVAIVAELQDCRPQERSVEATMRRWLTRGSGSGREWSDGPVLVACLDHPCRNRGSTGLQRWTRARVEKFEKQLIGGKR
ncbi:hypothetical protein BKA70DRAFT_1223570 [Coprinopsis sp. MPI-PUGE-AT-0042]|nr:hypothetical protein BKA70DRAFT_1223570 [Coprinopsis sp. MPI-PUGE-AT-0042]